MTENAPEAVAARNAAELTEPEGVITAYEIHPPHGMELEPAPIDRDWMDATPTRFAYRCLPLNIANQNGWVVRSPVGFGVYWYGGPHHTDLEVRWETHPDTRISSHFGSGVVTFSLPYLFRTPPGINLWVKGPSNMPKDGVTALEGVVETDWSPATFTMNWKVTRPYHWVTFARGEPICMVVPLPRGFAEDMQPRQRPLAANPALLDEYKRWDKGRTDFLKGLRSNDPEAVKLGWQKDYFQGQLSDGSRFKSHQTRLSIKRFDRGG